ncbi:hypothetical protein GQ42DRAFT_165864 [Ramicandelaber brevisporus]|nr:hypothetical protein GQ42DRAFT_165864 [Ramicandelaber brevisporus]
MTRLFVVQTAADGDDKPSGLNSIWLNHPRAGKQALFFITSSGLYEPHRIGEPFKEVKVRFTDGYRPPQPRSWLVGNQVISDGRYTMITPVDPLYILLSFLDPQSQQALSSSNGYDEERQRFQQLDQLLSECGMDEETIESLTSLPGLMDNLRHLCESRTVEIGGETIHAFMFSQQRATKWLQLKFNSILTSLSATENCDLMASVTSTFAQSVPNDAPNRDQIIEEANREAVLHMMGEYMNDKWYAILKEHAGEFTALKSYGESKSSEIARMAEINADIESRTRTRSAAATKTSASAAPAKPKPNQPKKAKVNTAGVRSITSFFKKV